jgi:hypothetical protein
MSPAALAAAGAGARLRRARLQRAAGMSEPLKADSLDWPKFKNPEARGVRREAQEDWEKEKDGND